MESKLKRAFMVSKVIVVLLCLILSTSEGLRELVFNCGFEIDTCGLETSPNHFNNVSAWQRSNKKTPSQNTGPNAAYNGTYFIFFLSSLPNNINSSNLPLTLTLFPSASSFRLKFAIHAYGSAIQGFNIRCYDVNMILMRDDKILNSQLQTSSDAPWTLIDHSYTFMSSIMEIQFIVSCVPYQYKANIAIDDLSVFVAETFSDWSSWSVCSASCRLDSGSPIISRFRICYFGSCMGSLSETQECNENTFCEGTLTGWSSWGPCSASCDTQVNGPYRYRSQNCIGASTWNPNYVGCNGANLNDQQLCNQNVSCPGESNQIQTCNSGVSCPADTIGSKMFPLKEYFNISDTNYDNYAASYLCQMNSINKCCSCDTTCFLQKRCCVDILWNQTNPLPLNLYLQKLVEVSKSIKETSCEEVLPIDPKFDHVIEKILMVHSCMEQSTIKDKENCINSSKNPLIENIPVFGSDHLLYRNAACARCNFINYTNVNLKIKCKSNQLITINPNYSENKGILKDYKKCEINIENDFRKAKYMVDCSFYQSLENRTKLCSRENPYYDLCNAYLGRISIFENSFYSTYDNYDCYKCRNLNTANLNVLKTQDRDVTLGCGSNPSVNTTVITIFSTTEETSLFNWAVIITISNNLGIEIETYGANRIPKIIKTLADNNCNTGLIYDWFTGQCEISKFTLIGSNMTTTVSPTTTANPKILVNPTTRVSYSIDLTNTTIDLPNSTTDVVNSTTDVVNSTTYIANSKTDIANSKTDIPNIKTDMVNSYLKNNITNFKTDMVNSTTYITNFKTDSESSTSDLSKVTFSSCLFFQNPGLFFTINASELKSFQKIINKLSLTFSIRNLTNKNEIVLRMKEVITSDILELLLMNNILSYVSSFIISSVKNQIITEVYGFDVTRVFKGNKLCGSSETIEALDINFTPSCNYVTGNHNLSFENTVLWIDFLSPVNVKKLITYCKSFHLHSGCSLQQITSYKIDSNQTLYFPNIKRFSYGITEYVPLEIGVGICYLHFNESVWKASILKAEYFISIIGTSISIFSYIIILLVYGCFKELKTWSSLVQAIMCINLFFSDIVYLIATQVNNNALFCKIVSIILHWLLLVSYLSVLILALDIAIAFNSYSPRLSKYNQLIKYCMVIYVIPSIIVAVNVALEETGRAYIGYGDHGVCWIVGFYPRLFSYIVPAAIVLLLALVCLFFTVHKINKVEKRSKKTLTAGRSSKFSFAMVASKFTLMLGVTELLGFIQIVKTPLSEDEDKFNYAFGFIFICCRSLKGVFLFVVFISSRKVKQQFNRRSLNFRESLRNTFSNKDNRSASQRTAVGIS